MTGYIILGIAIMLFVLLLTLIAINKGYAFKHSIDELPEGKVEHEDRTNDNHG